MAKDGKQRGPGGGSSGTAPEMGKGQPASPSMGGILKYIANRKTSGEGGPGEQTGAMKGNEGEYESPYPTGGAPRDEDDEGNNVPGQSDTEAEMACQKCGHKNKKTKRESSNFDSKE